MTDEELVLFAEDFSRNWVVSMTPIMESLQRVAVQTAVQLTQYSRELRDMVNSYKPFRRQRERYLRRRRQTRATFHGK